MWKCATLWIQLLSVALSPANASRFLLALSVIKEFNHVLRQVLHFDPAYPLGESKMFLKNRLNDSGVKLKFNLCIFGFLQRFLIALGALCCTKGRALLWGNRWWASYIKPGLTKAMRGFKQPTAFTCRPHPRLCRSQWISMSLLICIH